MVVPGDSINTVHFVYADKKETGEKYIIIFPRSRATEAKIAARIWGWRDDLSLSDEEADDLIHAIDDQVGNDNSDPKTYPDFPPND